MFAIGFLSLLSVGFVAMAFDGDDDPVGLEQNEDTQDDLNPPQHQGDDLLSFFNPGTIPLEDPDAEEIQRINAFIAELEANPSDDMSERFEAFIAQLEAERAAEAEEEAAAEEIIEDEETTPEEEVAEEAPQEEPAAEEIVSEDDAVARPPMGDSFTDPSKQAPVPFVLNPVEDETEGEPEGEETVEDEPPVVVEPEQDPLPASDLVTVTGPDGEAVDLELIVANGAEAETPSDADYVVTAPEGVNRIEVGYDDHTTFRIDYNVGTKSVDAGLNSEINGNDGVNSRTITWEPDENGANVRTLSWVKEFESSTNVIMHVAEDDIGRHVAQIELLNPGDVLKFDFENDVTGNLHLVYDETEEGTEGETNTTKRAFLIRTDADVTSLSTDQIAALINDADGQNASGQVLAEIYLGEETLLIKGDPTSGEDYEVRMTNYINDKPVITSTIAFTSITETQDLLVGEEPAAAEAADGQTEPSGDESTEGGFGDLLEGAGINPAFFGF